MILLKLLLKILVLPVIITVTLIQWGGIFSVSCSAWIFNLLSSLLFLLGIVAVFGGASVMQVIPLLIIAFMVFVVPFVGEWIVERVIDINMMLRDILSI